MVTHASPGQGSLLTFGAVCRGVPRISGHLATLIPGIKARRNPPARCFSNSPKGLTHVPILPGGRHGPPENHCTSGYIRLPSRVQLSKGRDPRNGPSTLRPPKPETKGIRGGGTSASGAAGAMAGPGTGGRGGLMKKPLGVGLPLCFGRRAAGGGQPGASQVSPCPCPAREWHPLRSPCSSAPPPATPRLAGEWEDSKDQNNRPQAPQPKMNSTMRKKEGHSVYQTQSVFGPPRGREGQSGLSHRGRWQPAAGETSMTVTR